MPQIIEYRQRIDTPDIPRQNVQLPGRVAGALELAGPALAKGVADLAEGLDRREEREAAAWAASELSGARLHWAAKMAELQATAEPGAPEFAKSTIDQFNDYANERLKRAPSDRARIAVGGRFAQYRAELGKSAIEFEAKARVDLQEDQFRAGSSNVARLMQQDPGQYRGALDEQLELIDRSALPPVRRSAMRESTVNAVSEAAVWAQIQKSPGLFLQSIGMTPQEGGKQRIAPDMKGVTGNEAFDALKPEQRQKFVQSAFQIKAQMDMDEEKSVKARSQQLSEDGLKMAWDLEKEGKLNRTFVEMLRPMVSQGEYHTLLNALERSQRGEPERDDPEAVRQLLNQLYGPNPDGVHDLAMRYSRSRLIKNETLTSMRNRARDISRTEGPKSEYERGRAFIHGSLDPGPMVPDPAGRRRMAEALETYDRWHNAQNRTDEQIRDRAREIVDQFVFVDLRETTLMLPVPRSAPIARDFSDLAKSGNQISNAIEQVKRKRSSGEFTQADYNMEMDIINRWIKAYEEAKRQHAEAEARKAARQRK